MSPGLWMFPAASWSAALVGYAATFGLVVLAVGVAMCVWRIVTGPTLADRGVAVDTLGVQVLGLVVLLALRDGELLFLDGMLVIALLSFAGTVAIAQFVARPSLLRRARAGAAEGGEAS